MKASVQQNLISPSPELYGDAALAEEFIGGDRTDENGRLSRLELATAARCFF